MLNGMTRVVLIGIVVALGAGCGGDEGGIQGNWINLLSSSCAAAINFQPDGEYGANLVCQLQGSSTVFGADGEGGTYSVAGDKVTLTPKRASCPTAPPVPATATFQIDGDALALGFPEGALIYSRSSATAKDAAGATLLWGCWDMGKFTQHALRDL